MEPNYEIIDVDEENETAAVIGIFEGNGEIRIFNFDNFEMDYDDIKIGQKVILERIKNSEFFDIPTSEDKVV